MYPSLSKRPIAQSILLFNFMLVNDRPLRVVSEYVKLIHKAYCRRVECIITISLEKNINISVTFSV